MAQSGVTPDSIKYALSEGTKGGREAIALSALGYGVSRTIGQFAAQAATGILENLEIAITDNIMKNIMKMVNMGVAGALTITVFSVYQLAKLKRNGLGTGEALRQVGRQALFSLFLLAVSVAAQGIWGGTAGIIVSLSTGIVIIGYSAADTVHQRKLGEEIRVYTIKQCYPTFT